MDKELMREHDFDKAVEMVGYALFNLTKGNSAAAETLLRKAYKYMTGREWDEYRGQD